MGLWSSFFLLSCDLPCLVLLSWDLDVLLDDVVGLDFFFLDEVFSDVEDERCEAFVSVVAEELDLRVECFDLDVALWSCDADFATAADIESFAAGFATSFTADFALTDLVSFVTGGDGGGDDDDVDDDVLAGLVTTDGSFSVSVVATEVLDNCLVGAERLEIGMAASPAFGNVVSVVITDAFVTESVSSDSRLHWQSFHRRLAIFLFWLERI